MAPAEEVPHSVIDVGVNGPVNRHTAEDDEVVGTRDDLRPERFTASSKPHLLCLPPGEGSGLHAAKSGGLGGSRTGP